jgi:hypothetical protein
MYVSSCCIGSAGARWTQLLQGGPAAPMSVLKRRRLVGLGGVSERALAEILVQIRDDPCLLPEDEAGAELVRKRGEE